MTTSSVSASPSWQQHFNRICHSVLDVTHLLGKKSSASAPQLWSLMIALQCPLAALHQGGNGCAAITMATHLGQISNKSVALNKRMFTLALNVNRTCDVVEKIKVHMCLL